jgi:protein-S-isoprenylcysteine O-methyltransferase Ste14
MVVTRISAYTILVAALLFGLSGRIDWPMAWIYLLLLTASTGINIHILVRVHPDLAAERMKFTRSEGIKAWDKILSPVVGVIGPILILVVCAMEKRWASAAPFDPALQWASMVLVALSSALSSWALFHNRYFSSVVRIQKDRGHAVVDTGPYRFVRHPGYSGGVFYYLSVPLALGSLWGLVPAGLTLIAVVVRTALEDATLRRELEGYIEYTKTVRYRLIPGLW